MNAEVQWWLLILGIVIGGALVYLVMADLRSAEDDGRSGERLGDEDDDDDYDDYDDEDEDDDEQPASDDADSYRAEPELPDGEDDRVDRRTSS